MSERIQATELMNPFVLVLAAHPDDEVLGCGGSIAKLAAEGAQVHVAYLADGVSARGIDDNARNAIALEELTARRNAAHAACEILGVKSLSFGDFPDNRMDSVDLLDIVKVMEALIAKYRPDTVFTHHLGDVNVDHRRVYEAVAAACRPQNGHPVRTLLSFEVASSTEWQLAGSDAPFVANWFIDISSTLKLKLDALDAYAAELRDWPHPRSRQGIEYLARWRGATIGVDAAEAFVLGRKLA